MKPCRGSAAGRVAALALLAFSGGSSCSPGPLDAIGIGPDTLAAGLMAHYTFDEGTGTTLVDHSGNKRDGTLTGGTWIADGQFAGALHFAGTDYVTIANFPDATSSFSVSAWVRTTNMPADNYETIVSTEVVFSGGWQLNLDKTTTTVGIHAAFWDTVTNAYTYYECPCVPVDQWTHVASVVDHDARTLSVYVNGQLETTTPAPDAISAGSPALYLGRWTGQDRLLVGDIDDLAIYGRALASVEIIALGQHPPPDPQ